MEKNDYAILKALRFCLRILYPKFNSYIFLVFLAIKYRYLQQKLSRINFSNMYRLQTLPENVLKSMLKDHITEDYLQMLGLKCIVIPKDCFIDLCVENFFYVDNGVLWVTLTLTSEYKKRYKKENQTEKANSFRRFNLNLTSDVHNKLWSNSIDSLNNMKIVPIIGSKLVQNTAYISETELHNMITSFGIIQENSVEVSFHPMKSFEISPKIAATAEVCLIVNDYDLPNDFIKEILSNYFEKPKLISEKDIITIDLTEEITAKYYYKYLDLIEACTRLSFKCTKLSNNKESNVLQTFYIVKGVTQLSLGESMHAVKHKSEFPTVPGLRTSIHSCPQGLKEKFNQIQESIRPFITETLSDSMSSPIIPMLLLTGPIGSGKHLLVKTLTKCNGHNFVPVDCNMLQSSTSKQTESKIYASIQKAKAAAPAIVLLDNFEVFAVDTENNEDHRIVEYFINILTDLYQNYTKHSIIFIAVTENRDLKPNIKRLFLENFHMPKLNLQQRFEMLQWFTTIMDLNINNQVDEERQNGIIQKTLNSNLNQYTNQVLQRVASKTETFSYGHLDTLMHFALKESFLKQVNNYPQLPHDPNLHVIYEDDFNCALESIKNLQSQHLDAPKIPKVYWDDIGGLEKLKKELLKTIEFPIKFPHLFKNSSLKRSGILLYGPPGCGKTLVAKAVSTELNVSFMSVKGPELLNMYIGQSEENVRKVFESARASSPCIVFLDELDALAPRRGAAGDSGGASDRVVSQLLAELDPVTSDDDADISSFVFVMGATNRPDLLEQSLLRPGRLDKLIYVGPYCGLQEKTSVLRALCRSYKLRAEVDLEKVAAALPERCTGADLLQIVSTAQRAAIRSLVDKINCGVIKESDLSADSVILGVSELWEGVETFRPSVTEEELNYYGSLQTIL